LNIKYQYEGTVYKSHITTRRTQRMQHKIKKGKNTTKENI